MRKMPKIWRFLSLILAGLGLALITSPSLAASCDHEDKSFHCVEYINNYDGDTITVHIPSVHPFFGNKISVRVLGIDAPELKTTNECEKRMAEKAREQVAEMLSQASSITLKSIGKDKYFRVLAEVRFDGKDLSEQLLKSRLAVPYDGGHKPETNWCDLE